MHRLNPQFKVSIIIYAIDRICKRFVTFSMAKIAEIPSFQYRCKFKRNGLQCNRVSCKNNLAKMNEKMALIPIYLC